MAIVKQNTLISANGKLITNAEGKLLKQNYYKGLGLKNTNNNNAFGLVIPTPSIPIISGQFEMLLFSKIDSIGYSTYFNNTWSFNTNAGFFYPEQRQGVNHKIISVGTMYNEYQGYDASSYNDTRILSIGFSNNNLVSSNYSIQYPAINSAFAAANLLDVRLFNNPYTSGSNPYVTIYAVYLFNRLLSNDERIYASNNNMFNLPASLEGCFCALDFDNGAEQVTVGGVDYAGIIDTSGNNNHGYFVGLPAGSISSQLAYVNNPANGYIVT